MMRKDDKNFDDQMWIHKCYNSSICMISFEYPDPDCHVLQLSLTNDDCRNLQECIYDRVYLNLLEPDSVMKDNKDYSFAVKPTDECELLIYLR